MSDPGSADTPTQPDPTGLTDDELAAMELTVQLVNLVSGIVGDGPTRRQDLSEFALRIHGIQHMIMAQAAARAHPELFRLLGDVV